MAKKMTTQELINEFKNYLTLYYNTNQRLVSRRMTMLSKNNCDICDKSTTNNIAQNNNKCSSTFTIK